MTRYEKMLLLSRWADRYRPGGRPLAATEKGAALKHGLAAVRAMQCALDDAETHGTSWAEIRETTRHAKDEARLAFRSALNAVGLKTL